MTACTQPQSKAIKAAFEAVSGFDQNDIWYAISENMDREDYARIYSAVDPEFAKNKDNREQLYQTIAANATKEQKEALSELDDAINGELYVRELAWFYIGFAAAQKISSWSNPAKGQTGVSYGRTTLKRS